MRKRGQAPNRRSGCGETRGRRRQKLSEVLDRVTSPLFRKQGFAVREVLLRWPAIVGGDMAAQSCPEKLVFPPGDGAGGILHVRTSGPLALEIQHLEPLIIERINTYYGFAAVARLRLKQGPVPAPEIRARTPERELTAGEIAALDDLLAGVSDPELKASLGKLGRHLVAAGPEGGAGA